MKQEKNTERLSMLLGEIDPALLEEAYRTDTPEKLRGSSASSERPYRRIIFPRLAVAAVSMILTFSMLLGVFVLLRPADPGIDPPQSEQESGTVSFTPDNSYIDPASIVAPWKTGKLTLTSLTYAPKTSKG